MRKNNPIQRMNRLISGIENALEIGWTPPTETTSVQSCGNCTHFSRCEWLIQRKADDVLCDWIPSRFVAKGEDKQ